MHLRNHFSKDNDSEASAPDFDKGVSNRDYGDVVDCNPNRYASHANTVLHQIRSIRDDITKARLGVRIMSMPEELRIKLLQGLESVDSILVSAYRYERFGKERSKYDRIIASETNGPRRLYLDLDTGVDL